VVVGADAGLSDASVSGPLAATVAGPLLLTQKGKLPAATVAELDRRGASVRTAYVVGGTGVVSDAVLTTLRSRGLTVQRIGGRDRYETAALVAKAIKARRTVTAVVVGGGIDLPDALSASGPASALGEPILLTPTTQLSGYAKSFITGAGVRTARVVGGTAMVSTAVEDQLRAAGITSLARLGGSNRYAVSATIAQFYRPLMSTTSEVVLASGVDGNMVDALVSSSLQRLIVLTSRYSLDPAAATALQSTPLLETVTAVGGTGVLYPRALTGAANS
jgi:stage II sporulation protein D